MIMHCHYLRKYHGSIRHRHPHHDHRHRQHDRHHNDRHSISSSSSASEVGLLFYLLLGALLLAMLHAASTLCPLYVKRPRACEASLQLLSLRRKACSSLAQFQVGRYRDRSL